MRLKNTLSSYVVTFKRMQKNWKNRAKSQIKSNKRCLKEYNEDEKNLQGEKKVSKAARKRKETHSENKVER